MNPEENIDMHLTLLIDNSYEEKLLEDLENKSLEIVFENLKMARKKHLTSLRTLVDRIQRFENEFEAINLMNSVKYFIINEIKEELLKQARTLSLAEVFRMLPERR